MYLRATNKLVSSVMHILERWEDLFVSDLLHIHRQSAYLIGRDRVVMMKINLVRRSNAKILD